MSQSYPDLRNNKDFAKLDKIVKKIVKIQKLTNKKYRLK